MAYIFQEDELPKLVSVVPGRERTFFVNKELANIDDMLAGIMRYKQGASSPYHYHVNCKRRIVSKPRFSTARRTISAGIASTAGCGCRLKWQQQPFSSIQIHCRAK